MSYQSQRPPSLVMRQGPRPNQAFPLHKAVLTLGRAVDNDIVVDDAEVSRHHARLTLRGNDWVLEDLNSRNGTFVNGQRITGPVILTPGSQVALGPDVLFSVEGGAPAVAMARRPAARRGGARWLLLAGLATLVVAVLAGAAALAYFYLNPPVIEARDVAELFSTGPDIAFQEPAPGTQVGLGGSVLVFATARDEDRVTRVDLWVDDQLVVQQVSPEFEGVTPLSLIHSLVATTPGTHSLRVQAYDSLGAMGESPTLHVTVLEEPEPAPATVQYIVQPGDTPATVAQVMSTTVAAIQAQNPGMSQVITPGQTIVVPAPPPPQPEEPKPQPSGPASGGQGPVAGGPGPGPDQKKPPGLVPVDVIRDPGLLAPGVAQIDPAQIQFPIGVVMLDPPKTTVKAPVWKKVEAGDCAVTLSWQAGQQGERYKISREPFPAGVGLWHWIDVPQGQTTYTDKVPSPGQYRYQVVAMTEIRGKNLEPKSNYETVTISPSAACIPRGKYKLVHFQPLKFEPVDKYKEGALFVTVGGLTGRRVPPSQAKPYPVGDWSAAKEEVWPAPMSVYLNPDEPVRLEVSGEGFPGKPPPGLGSFEKAHSQSEMGPTKELTGGNEKFKLTYRLWVEDTQWTGQGTTKSIKPPTRLRLAANAQEMQNKWVYGCRGCDPATSRVLLWDLASDETAIDGYILYRGYSCPGQEGQVKAPQVLDKQYQGIHIPAKTEPVGCVARYQVSAFGRAGESDPSNELVLDTAPAVSRVKVTFKDLKLSQQTTSRIDLQANQYRSNSEDRAIRADEVLKLDQVFFYGKRPNNALTVSLDQGETLQVSLLAGFCKLEPSKPLDPTKSDTYQLHFQGAQGECWGTVEVGALEAVSAGQVARPQADIGILHPYLVGKDVYVRLDSLGPDSLSANQVEVKSYWLTPGTQDKPLSPVQTVTRWWPALAETMEVKVGSTHDIEREEVAPKKVPFYVKVTVLDFDDPYESNNVWQGEIPDLIPLKGEPDPSPKNLGPGYPCSKNEECASGLYCADGKRCALLKGTGQEGDYCHHNDHCEETLFCLCPGGYDAERCSEDWKTFVSTDEPEGCYWGYDGQYCAGSLGEDYLHHEHGTCVARDQNGAPCSRNEDCESGNCAEAFGGGKRCAPTEGEGQGYGDYCHHHNQCQSGWCRCPEEPENILLKPRGAVYPRGSNLSPTEFCTWGPGDCVPVQENGAKCWKNENCESGNCANEKCAPQSGTGAGGVYCNQDDQCESGICLQGKCYPREKNGAPCSSGRECLSGYCADGERCAPENGTGQAGEYCHHDDHCQSGFCVCPTGYDGKFCANWRTLKPNQYGSCWQLADNGDPCGKDSECESGHCADAWPWQYGRCAPKDGKGGKGDYCHHDNHCQSGRCDCDYGWWSGFCKDWEDWERSDYGTCK